MLNFSLLSERLNKVSRVAVAYILMGLFLLLNITAFSHPAIGAIKPPFLLMAIYYWSIYRPTLIPVFVIFLMGCLLDFLAGLPPGFNASVFVLLRWIIADQRRLLMAQTFIVLWLVFIFVCLVVYLIQWVLGGLFLGSWVHLLSLLGPFIISSILFPFVYMFLHLTHKILPTPAMTISLKGK